MSHVIPLQASETAPRIELDYGWEFLPDPSGRLRFSDLNDVSGWRTARAGLSWNVQFDDLRDYMGAAWYRTTVKIPTFQETRHVLLKFGAVDYFCELYVNGVHMGAHEGGYTPFSFEISGALHTGTNDIAVHVIDPPMNEADNRALFPDMMYNEIPHGKQSWYVQNSGIWQGVRLEFCPALYVDRVDMTPNYGGDFTAKVRLAGAGFTNDSIVSGTILNLEVSDTSGRVVFQTAVQVDSRSVYEIRGSVPQPRTWSPDSPNLYVVDASLRGAVQYRRRTRFGFRKFEARDGKFYLNDKPFYMVATLDQDFYPETIHTPASEEFVREMMIKAKRLGINVLRCHLKVAHPVYLDIADEIGMFVWAEMPSWSDSWFPSDHFSMRAALRGEQMFEEITARDWNHPCIVVRTIINESWGINLKDPEQRKWLRESFERVKRILTPVGRLIVDNSACEGNFHIKTDIEDFHQYYSMPDQVKLWDKWLAEFASRPSWTFSPYGDAERTGKEPLLVSEFGNWGLPHLPLNEELPWWFHYSFGGRTATTPSGVFERFREFGFHSVFRDYNDFAEETQQHQFVSLKYEIESIRSHRSIQGYVITGMTDVHWEVNGLLDMWRNPKIFADELTSIQQQDLLFARTPGFTTYSGQSIDAELLLSHYSDRNVSGARIRWITDSGASGQVLLNDLPSGELHSLGKVSWVAPDVDAPTVERLHMEVRARNGARIAENYLDFFVLPRIEAIADTPLSILQEDGKASMVAAALADRGYRLTSDAKNVVIGARLDERMLAHLKAGGSAILLADSEDALPAHSPVQVKLRAGSELDGRWFSNFNWIRPESPVFQPVAFGRVLGFESEAVVPEYVMTGVTAQDFPDVLCGATYGWLQHNSAITLQARVGGGKLLATTFRFDEYGRDAYATHLLDALIRYASGTEISPSLQLSL